MDKKKLSERHICTKFVTPAIENAGWDIDMQVREEVRLTKGRVIVRGKLVARGKDKRADYVLYYKSNIPVAVIEAKDNNHLVCAGIQQALAYAEMLGVPFAFSANGDGFWEHDGTGISKMIERDLELSGFPSPEILWKKYCQWKGIEDGFLASYKVVRIDFDKDLSGWRPGVKVNKYGQEIVDRFYNQTDFDRDLVLDNRCSKSWKCASCSQQEWRLSAFGRPEIRREKRCFAS